MTTRLRSFLKFVFLTGLISFCFLTLHRNAFAQITLTGDVDADFPVENCISDPGGNEISTPTGFISGFDIDKLCFYYDGLTGELKVGVTSFDLQIFGDIDGDGDPADSTTGLSDFADLGDVEHFVISIDIDGDSLSEGVSEETVDFLIGVGSGFGLDDLGAYRVDESYNPLAAASGFGADFGNDVTVLASPSVLAPDLEFTIDNFQDISVNGLDVQNTMAIMVVSGSTAVEAIGLDYIPSAGASTSHNFFDADDDGLEDWEETNNTATDPADADSDDDQILDGTEVNGDNATDPLDPDSDDDLCLDGEEDTNQNGVFEPDLGESDPNTFDTDGDGLDDCTELRRVPPTDPNKRDTDDGGVDDATEIENGFDPLDPSDDDAASIQVAGSLTFNQAQGSGLGCSVMTHAAHPGNQLFVLVGVALLFAGLFLARCFSKHS